MNETSDIPLSAPSAWLRVAEKVMAQHWPVSALYVVATPIGNLGDLSVRAWQALAKADVVAAEDTRVTRTMFDAWGLSTPLMAAHRHNEASAAQGIIDKLAAGQRVALVSDAGAPAVSDPGARIVRAVREAGFQVVPIPGPSAVIAALMASGATSDENPAFAFAGFAPPKSMARQRWLRRWAALAAPVVFFESPHRLRATLDDILETCGPVRRVTLARELSKRFEEVATVTAGDAQAWLDAEAHRGQGEFVLILHEAQGAPGQDVLDDDEDPAVSAQTDMLLDALLESLSVRDTVKVAQKVTGASKDVLYKRALQRKAGRDESGE